MEQRTFQKYSNDFNFVGYPLYYIVNGSYCDQLLCSHCCTEEYTGEETVKVEVNYDNHDLHCYICSDKIEAAYEEDDDDSDEDDYGLYRE